VWETATGKQLCWIKGEAEKDGIVKALSADGRRVLIGGLTEKGFVVRVCDLTTGREVRRFSSTAATLALAFSPDGSRVLTGGKDRHLRLWDVETGELICTFPIRHEDSITCVAFNGDGQLAISGSLDSTARLWKCPK
jgi:WD40 repeat protein